MSKPKIGINGFGRVGKLATRIALRKGLDVNGINDPNVDTCYMETAFKFDSVHGRWPGNVDHTENQLIVDGKVIEVSHEWDAGKIDWAKMNVEIVIEATGMFTSLERASMHLQAGAKKVIITAPSPDAPTFIMGVNHTKYETSMDVISNSSCAANCLAPLVKLLDQEFGLIEGFLTSIHSYTSNQRTVDGPFQNDGRAGRSAALNIVPGPSGAGKEMDKVWVEVKDRISSIAIRVPSADVSVLDLTVRLQREVNMDDIKECFKKASETPELKGILGYTEDEVVSCDFLTTTFSAIFDAKASMAHFKQFFKLIAWYDNEYAYSTRVVDMVGFVCEKGV